MHDGQEPEDGEEDTFNWLPGQPRLASLERIVDRWKRECTKYEVHHGGQPPEEIEEGLLYHYLWHPKRIPIAGNAYWDQDNTYLDFFPGPNGVAGQIANFGKGIFGVVQGTSFRAALTLFADALDSGEWLVRDGCCVPRNKRFFSWSKYTVNKAKAANAKASRA